jgi:hypothetical protein
LFQGRHGFNDGVHVWQQSLLEQAVSLIEHHDLDSLHFFHKLIRFSQHFCYSAWGSDYNMRVLVQLLMLNPIAHTSHDESLPEVHALSEDSHLLVDLHGEF